MSTGLAAATGVADFQGLAQLRAEARQDSPEALEQTARQFESLFIHMMLKSMRASTPGDGLLDSDKTRFYRGMFDQRIAQQMAQGEGIGLARMLYQQLGEPADSAPQPLARPYASPVVARAHAAPPEPAAQPARADASTWSVAGPQDYVRQVWPHAVRAGERLGVAPEVLVAQSALETGWGQKVIRGEDGHSSYNLFGIKAGGTWTGARARVDTLEHEGGVAVRKQASFRAYDSIGASFADYVDVVGGSPRYQDALEHAADPQAYLQALQHAGYATDPDYADKIDAILTDSPLAGVLSELKYGAEPPLT